MLNLSILKYLVLVVTALSYFNHVNADCIWYGECGPSQNDGVYNCKYNGPPKLLEPEIENLFEELCPHLYKGPNKTETCCNKQQINRIYKSMSLPEQLMSRCPACYTNFRAFLCDLTCNPDMQNFLQVTKEDSYNETNAQINEITYHISNEYVNTMYDSCKDVQYSSSNQKILDIMCGSQPDGCSPKKFVDYLGNNPESPFIFNMNITDDHFNITEYNTNNTILINPVNTSQHSCYAPIDMLFYEAAPCGCSDCEGSCPKPIPIPEVKHCKLWGFECLNVSMFGMFLVCSAGFMATLFITNAIVRKHMREDEIRREGMLSLFIVCNDIN